MNADFELLTVYHIMGGGAVKLKLIKVLKDPVVATEAEPQTGSARLDESLSTQPPRAGQGSGFLRRLHNARASTATNSVGPGAPFVMPPRQAADRSTDATIAPPRPPPAPIPRPPADMPLARLPRTRRPAHPQLTAAARYRRRRRDTELETAGD